MTGYYFWKPSRLDGHLLSSGYLPHWIFWDQKWFCFVPSLRTSHGCGTCVLQGSHAYSGHNYACLNLKTFKPLLVKFPQSTWRSNDKWECLNDVKPPSIKLNFMFFCTDQNEKNYCFDKLGSMKYQVVRNRNNSAAPLTGLDTMWMILFVRGTATNVECPNSCPGTFIVWSTSKKIVWFSCTDWGWAWEVYLDNTIWTIA